MTDRQRQVLKVMSDPVNRVTSLTDREREAIRGALARIDELERSGDCLECQGKGRLWCSTGPLIATPCLTCNGTGKRR